MWNRLTSALKTRSDADVPPSNVPSHPARGTKSLDLQRTLPALPPHEFDSPKPLPAPSPPSSPSKFGRRGLFHRPSTKSRAGGSLDNSSSVSLAKKVKASLNINTNFNASNVSIPPINEASDGTHMLSASDNGRPPLPFGSVRSAIQPRTAPLTLDLSAVNDATSYFSQPSGVDEMPKSAPILDSALTPLDMMKNGQGSVRSILKEKRTPGTGQSVRFFSRDAYRVISPETSTASASVSISGGDNMEKLVDMRLDSLGPLPAPSFARAHSDDSTRSVEDGQTNYLSAPDSINDLFSPLNAPSPASSRDGLFLDVQARRIDSDRRASGISQAGSTASLFVPIPAPDLDNPFDSSAPHDFDVQPIPFCVSPAKGLGIIKSEMTAESISHTHEERVSSVEMSKNVLHSTPNGIAHGTRSLGRAGGAFFRSLTEADSAREAGRSSPVPEVPVIPPPRSSSSLGLYKLFSKDADKDEPGVEDKSASGSTKSRRERSQSERVFFRPATPLQEELKKARKERPEADINDTTTADIVLSPGGQEPEVPQVSHPTMSYSADPFGANAQGYYTAEVGIPNSPPKLLQLHNRTESSDSKSSRTSNKSSKSLKSVSSRTSQKTGKSQTSISLLDLSADKSNSTSMSSYSDSGDLVLNLRTQLAFHQELTNQFEKDISSRDELVSLLNSRITNYEDEAKERTKTLRAWRKKFTEMEKACRVLEEEVDRSKQEIAERSVYDEASGDALRALHTQIKVLEKERRVTEKREKELKTENDKLRQQNAESAATEKQLRASIEETKGRVNVMEMGDVSIEGKVEDMRQLLEQGEEEVRREAERHIAAKATWDEERAGLMWKIEELKRPPQLQDVVDAREAEIGTLNEEIRSQWTRTEKMGQRIEELLAERVEAEKECEYLKAEVARLEEFEQKMKDLEEKMSGIPDMEDRMMHMEVEWTESENRRNELESELAELSATRDEEIREREQIVEQLNESRAESQEFQRSLQSLETRYSTIEQERDFAVADGARLERLLRERAEEISELQSKLNAKDVLLDSLQDDLSSLRRDHSRLSSDKTQSSAEVDDARSRMENALRAHAEAMAEAQLASERVSELEANVEKYRKQVHSLKQESADAEVKRVQLQKQLDQAIEDKEGLNMALELKQTDLELLRRKVATSQSEGVATPLASQRTGAGRRESAFFATPLPARPPSALSDTGSRSAKVVDTPSTVGKLPVLGRSTRANVSSASATPSASKAMGPPTHRPSLSGSSAPSILSRSLSGKTPSANASSTSAPGHRRRTSSSALSLTSRAALSRSVSATANISDTSSIAEDKENVEQTSSRAPTPSRTKSAPSSSGTRIARKSLVPATPA